MTFTPERLEQLFNEWLRRHTIDPTEFTGALDENYGKSCVDYLIQLDKDLV